MKNAICLHEEDHGVLWKHYEFRNETFEVRRSRRLVVSFFATVGNYDYGFYWYFYQDGTIQLEAKLTGIIQTAAVAPGEAYPWGGMVAEGLGGPTHQHFFNARLHMMVDGERNTRHRARVRAAAVGRGQSATATCSTRRPEPSRANATRRARPTDAPAATGRSSIRAGRTASAARPATSSWSRHRR